MNRRKSKRGRLAKQRIKLWNENPNCYYCGCLTVLVTDRNGGKALDNEATIEHLYSRINPLRYTPNLNHEKRRVLSCYKCNNNKSKEEQKNNIHLIRFKSGAWPFSWWMEGAEELVRL